MNAGMAWGAVALAAGLALARGLYEPRRLAVTRTTLVAERSSTRAAGAEAGESGPCAEDVHAGPSGCGGRRRAVRVALISDLHADKLWIAPERIIAELQKAPVDLVAFTGDLVGDDRHANQAAPFLEKLGAAVRRMGLPFLAVTGNHDGARARGLMQAAGMEILTDRQRHLTLTDGTAVLVTGLADRRPGTAAHALLRRATGSPEAIHVVLVHNPDAVLDLPEHGADFLLGGHFHGGQIYAPFQLEFRLLRRDRLPLLGYWRGPFRLRGYQGYISRGLGCVWLPLRFLSLPELAILELVVQDGPAGCPADTKGQAVRSDAPGRP